MKELLKKLRRYEIQIRKAINSYMQGDYHSVFKGSGLEFDDVRAYQYGDDVRTIDWNVTAKGHGTYVNVQRGKRTNCIFHSRCKRVAGNRDPRKTKDRYCQGDLRRPGVVGDPRIQPGWLVMFFR